MAAAKPPEVRKPEVGNTAKGHRHRRGSPGGPRAGALQTRRGTKRGTKTGPPGPQKEKGGEGSGGGQDKGLHQRGRYWSAEVTARSNALDLEPGVFTLDDPREVALSLKRSAEASTRRKSSPFRSAMSMLTFHINRAGRGLPEERRRVLEAAKAELRKLFGRG